jgi:hypothetical protein
LPDYGAGVKKLQLTSLLPNYADHTAICRIHGAVEPCPIHGGAIHGILGLWGHTIPEPNIGALTVFNTTFLSPLSLTFGSILHHFS